MAKIRTQADRRKHAVFTDQFGRKWDAEIETDTMHPCAATTPKGWRETPGCVTPEVYKKYPKIDDPFAMVIQMDDWIDALNEARNQYEASAANTAMFMSPDDNGARLFRAAEDGTLFIARALRNIVGEPPAPADLVRAMRAGNKWALGLVNPATGKPYPRPKWADKFFPVVTAKTDEFPDEFEDEEDEGFEAVDPDEAAAFPDETEDRPQEEQLEVPIEEPDEEGDEDDPFSHLASVATAPAPKVAPKPAPKPAAKKPAPKPVAKKPAPKAKPIPKPAPTSTTQE